MDVKRSSLGKVIWFTGLPSAGKTTLALHLKEKLETRQLKVFLLDGDRLRTGLNADLGFSRKDRAENIRRAAELARLLMEEGYIVLSTFISPFADDRAGARKIAGTENFVEVFVQCPLPVCEQRDVKGLYKKARAGMVPDFTGIDSPYEEPMAPDFVISTHDKSIHQAVALLEKFVADKL